MTSGNDSRRVFPVVPFATVAAFALGILVASKLVFSPPAFRIAVPNALPTATPSPPPQTAEYEPHATLTPTAAPSRMSDTAKRWMIAVGALTSVRNGDGYANLASNLSRQTVLGILKDSWEITDRTSAIETLEWLRTMGHMRDYDDALTSILARTGGKGDAFASFRADTIARTAPGERKRMEFMLDFIWEHRNDPKGKIMASWDCGRIVNVARWSYTAGFVTEDEAWEYLAFAAKAVKYHYGSWGEMGTYYLLGRSYWQGSGDNGDIQRSYGWLVSDPGSPWKTVPWNLKLQ